MDTNVVIAGASAAALLAFLVQTTRETLNLNSRYIPLAAIIWGFVLFLSAAYLPSAAVEASAKALLVAAGVSASVRYVKNGAVKGDDVNKYPVAVVQRDDLRGPRDSSSQGSRTTLSPYQPRSDRISNQQPTEPFPLVEEI